LLDFHYLHLKGLRDGLIRALSNVPAGAGWILDVYCGTQPYRPLLGDAKVVGLDIDSYFRRVEVIAERDLPFADETFDLVLSTQALYFVEDDAALVTEMNRVVRSGGYAIVTVPYLFVKSKTGNQRRYSAEEFSALFSTWEALDLQLVGGIGTGFGYAAGRWLQAAVRRARWTRPLAAVLAGLVNVFGLVLDAATRPLSRRWPATLIAVAQR